MRTVSKLLVLAACIAFAGTGDALAQGDPACGVASSLISPDFRLSHVAAAIASKQLTVAVVGSASSTLPDAQNAYPARLEQALAEKLPGVAVKVIAHVKARESAGEALPQMRKLMAIEKPALIVWQVGTVEAIRGIDPDTFSDVLRNGIDAAFDASSDVVLMNMQYSPRTELMITMSPYGSAIRITALQHEVLLFDRLAIMRRWGELGTFDLNEVTKKMDTANRVHDCIGHLLADLVVEAARLPASSENGIR